jgi:hypothetical protein
VTEPQSEPQALHTAAPTRPALTQRLIAFTFLGAFSLSILTVVLTGLAVRAPGSGAPRVESVTLAIGEVRTVNLQFVARAASDAAQLTVDLPAGVELRGHEGLRHVAWTAPLTSGSNVLPLEVAAVSGRGGQIAARLQHADGEQAFVVNVIVVSP